MGKLSIKVHGCRIHRPCARADVTPRVVVTVDSTYRFQTHSHKNTFAPTYDETFVVGNTHRLAVIEVSVYDVVEAKSALRTGFSHDNNPKGCGAHSRRSPRTVTAVTSFFDRGAGSKKDADREDPEDAEEVQEANLLGRCYISIERLVQGQPKHRTYVLGSPIPRELARMSQAVPLGIAGTIDITLTSDALGESKSALRLDDAAEQHFVHRLKRFLLRYDKPKLQVMDLLLAGVRGATERLSEKSRYAAADTAESGDAQRDRSTAAKLPPAVTGGANGNLSLSRTKVTVSKRHTCLNFYRPIIHETFEELMHRLCSGYGGMESGALRVSVRVDGCTNLDKKSLNTAMLGSDDVYTILRSESEEFATATGKLQGTIVWTEANETVFDVVDPGTFTVLVVVMGRSSSKHYEIGRTSVSVAPLALDHESGRHLYLCAFDNMRLPTLTGAVHLAMRPLNFGLTPLEHVKHVDEFFDRLSKYFKRYDVVRVPLVDHLVRARIGELEEYMQDLVVEHGREPGSVKLLVTVNEIVALQEAAGTELSDKEVCVVVTMGGVAVRTKTRKICRFVATPVHEGYCFDVVRETDLIRLEVVRASDESVIYGRVDFTCVSMQRGVPNRCKMYLVGNAGTASAYISGIIRVTLHSDEIGTEYAKDEEQERGFYGRLRRYAYRRMPENLHRVNLAVALVFDMESFMAQLSSQYGEEDPTMAIYFTVIGCRQLRSRFGGVNPYVVVRVGVDAYHTKSTKDNTEPDYFEFCEFYYDRPGDNFISLIVMDKSGVGDDKEIGRAVISLSDVTLGQQYHDFLPLRAPPVRRARFTKRTIADGRGVLADDLSFSGGVGGFDDDDGASVEETSEGGEKHKNLGSVGFKYVVVDMNLADRTRCRIAQEAERAGGLSAPVRRIFEGGHDGMRGSPSVNSLGQYDGGGGPHGIAPTSTSGGDGGSTMGGWMTKVRGWQRAIEKRTQNLAKQAGVMPDGGDTNSTHGGGGGGGGGRSMNNTMDCPDKDAAHTQGGGNNGGDMASAHSKADIPTRNLMDEGGMDLDAFLSAPILSKVNSVANSLMDEDESGYDSVYDEDSVGDRGSNLYGGGGGGGRHRDDPALPGVRAPGVATLQSKRKRCDQSSNNSYNNRQLRHSGVMHGENENDGDGDDLHGLLEHANTTSCFPDFAPVLSTTTFGDHSTHGSGPLVGDNSGPKYLRVRVLYCKNLLSTGKQRPNPYLLLSNLHETHRTCMEFNTVNPRYNEEFRICVEEPMLDALHVSVLTDTPYGSKKLGHCVLSLRNVQRGEWHTRWASFVAHSLRPSAFEQGSVCLSLMGENFGVEYLPPSDAESRLRERVRDFLVNMQPTQLHRLEWFVGEYSDQESNLVASLFGSYYSSADVKESATLEVVVKSISNLCIDGGMLLSGTCAVKLRCNGRTHAKTRSVAGTDGSFVLNETLRFKVENPATAQLRISVIANGKVKAGESVLSLQDLHCGVLQERTHVLAINARSADPHPSGLITVLLLSNDFGSSSAPPTTEDDVRFYRLQRFFFYYKREEVAMTDIRYSSTLNVNALLRRLVQRYGPEPGNYRLQLTVKRCLNLHCSLGNRMIHPFCVVRCGMNEYRTTIVEGRGEYVFHERFDLQVGLPDLEQVVVILFDFTPAKSNELGRTQVPLKSLVRDQANEMRLPLVSHAGTRAAEVNGVIELEAYTEEFGQANGRTQSMAYFLNEDPMLPSSPTPPSTVSRRKAFNANAAEMAMSLFGRRSKSHVPASASLPHDTYTNNNSILAATVNPPPRAGAMSQNNDCGSLLSISNVRSPAEEDVLSAGGGTPRPLLTFTPTPTTAATHAASRTKVKVSLVGFVGFKTQDMELYLRVTSGKDTLLRTKPISVAELATLKEDVAFETDDQAIITDRVFTLKMGYSSFLSKEAVCYADFTIVRCPPGITTEKRLRLYECTTNAFLGISRLSVQVPASATCYDGAALEPVPPHVAEPVLDDLASLVAKYSPKDLRKLDLSLYRTTDVRRLHRALRTQLSPSVVATAYLAIHEVKLHLAPGPTSLTFKHTCTIAVEVGDYSAEVMKKTAATTSNASTTVLPYGMSCAAIATLDFCPLRVDITPTGPDAILTICVNDRQSKTKVTEVGRAVVSLRALLSLQVYDLGEKVTVPLVECRREANRVHATLLGSLTFSIYAPAFEFFPPSLRFASQPVDRRYIRYWNERIYALLKNYDANSCVDLHARLYEQFVGTRTWQRGLPQYLTELVERWGPELEVAGPVPPLD